MRQHSRTSSTLGWVLRRIMACRYTALGLMVKRCRKYSPANATMAADSDCADAQQINNQSRFCDSAVPALCALPGELAIGDNDGE